MKKNLLTILFCCIISLSLVACGKSTKQTAPTDATEPLDSISNITSSVTDASEESDYDKNFKSDYEQNYVEIGGQIALISDTETIFDKSYIESLYDGVGQYAFSSGKTFSYYFPETDSESAYEKAILKALNNKAQLVVTATEKYNKSVGHLQSEYPDIFFLMVDGIPTDQNNNPITINQNVHCIAFDEYTSGYIAGYITAMDGYRHFGFIGGEEVQSVKEYGYGYLNGIYDYATQNKIESDIMVNYWYSNTFNPSDEIYSKAKTWYDNDTEVIFSCGGSIYNSIIKAAEETDKKVIGVDINQNELSQAFITSAAKGVDIATIEALDSFFASNEWTDDLAGKQTIYGTDMWCASIPADENTWRFENVSLDDYLEFYLSIRSNQHVITPKIDEFPNYPITINRE